MSKIEAIKASLRRVKPHSRRRVELGRRLIHLVVQQLKSECRAEKRKRVGQAV